MQYVFLLRISMMSLGASPVDWSSSFSFSGAVSIGDCIHEEPSILKGF